MRQACISYTRLQRTGMIMYPAKAAWCHYVALRKLSSKLSMTITLNTPVPLLCQRTISVRLVDDYYDIWTINVKVTTWFHILISSSIHRIQISCICRLKTQFMAVISIPNCQRCVNQTWRERLGQRLTAR